MEIQKGEFVFLGKIAKNEKSKVLDLTFFEKNFL